MAQRRDRVLSPTSNAFPTSQPAETTVPPPFSEDLRIDRVLKLSHDDFKQSIEQFYAHKQLSAIDQLKATPRYPTTHVLAQFAYTAYLDCTHEDPKPPDGWQLLTTASNIRDENGYFGTAYWHPEHQQLVIAHRGTGTKNVYEFLNDVYTDLGGVLSNNYVPQMSSASTFANKVVAVLQEIEQEQNVSFELFFTGHSLGGWLAQITNFTTEYLEVINGTFLMKRKTEEGEQKASNTVQNRHDVRQSCHPHTVVFDSPGCEEMLLKMKRTFDVSHKKCSIDLQHLDITSYLSAPNRINTCNSHLGTVYRIFTDLSDMGWKEKHTPLYNLATHRMDKIEQAFDPETGQVLKDDKGRLKIQNVVDWPVSTGLTGGAKYNEFFKWAEQLNNYHPEEMDISHSKVPKGYHPIRYQTKAYDECAKSLSVFTQDEREFLEHYGCLRHMPEFYIPEGLSVTFNAEADTEVEQNLQNFQTDNESFRCTDASKLHALIPYVKRLLRFFPHIKKEVTDKLSSSQFRNRFYQLETQRYVEKIRQRAQHFIPCALDLREFLTSDRQIWQLRMIPGDAWTGITKVYHFLQNTSCTTNLCRDGHYTILKLKRLLTVNRMINLNALMAEMETPHLLMIACGTNQRVNDELRDTLKELFSILKQKNNAKIILTTQSEGEIADLIEEIAAETLGDGFITTDEELTWSDLTASSQRIMLEKTVIFQGKRVALKQLISAESMTDSFPLCDLSQETELRIGEEPVPSACSGYNENYYVNRTFNLNIAIKQDISSDERQGKFADLLAYTEKEFKQLCQQNPMGNVHWLVKDKSGELNWWQSQGNFKTLREYIDDDQKSHSYSASDLDKLLQQAKQKKIMLIADKGGMGKTTVLTHLSKRIRDKSPAYWLVRIDLNDYTELLMDQKGTKMDKGRVLEFLSEKVLKLESDIEKELFKKSFEGNEVSKAVVMVDGFDEISPSYKETVIDMLQVLKQTSLEQLWVTTRPHLREELEDKLQQLSYTLQPFSEEDQVEFLKKFLSQNSNFEITVPHRLEMYAKALIRMFSQSISDKEKEFTGIPLQTRLLAEIFEKEFTSFYESKKPDPELPHKLDLLELYRKFIESKYEIYEVKHKTQTGNMAAIEQRKRDIENIERQHERLALKALFPEDQVTFLENYQDSVCLDEELARIGIVQINQESKLQFIHRTFAEYFVAEFLINRLTTKTKPHIQVQEILLNTVLLETDCHVIRAFLDGPLEKCEPSYEVLEEFGKRLDEQWKEKGEQGNLEDVTTVLHKAAKEDNVQIIGFLLKSLKSGKHLSTVRKLLLHKDRWGQTAWHKAAENDSVKALEKLWEWAEEVNVWQEGAERGHSETSATIRALVEEEELRLNMIKNTLFVDKDQHGNTAWHGAAQRDSLKALQTLWIWGKKVELNPHELLLAQNEEGNTAWQVAVQRGNFEVLENIWAWAKEAEINLNVLKDEFLLAKDKNGYTVWNRAAESGSLETLDTLWLLGKEAELKPDKMFLDQGTDGNTAWQVAAQRGQFEVLQKLWEWAKAEKIGENVLKDKLLLAKDKNGNTALHRAAERGNLEALETLWSWAKEEKLPPYEMLLAQSETGLTAWHLAADRDHFEAFKKMWEWAKDALDSPKDLKKKLVLTKDMTGYTVWHRAAQRGTVEELEKLWRWAKSETKKRRIVANPK